MKKLLAILMALAMLLSFAACGGNEKPDTTDHVETTTEAPRFDETVVTDGKANKEYTSVTIGANTYDAIESNTGVTYLVAKTSTGNAMYVMVWSCTVEDAKPLIETIVIG